MKPRGRGNAKFSECRSQEVATFTFKETAVRQHVLRYQEEKGILKSTDQAFITLVSPGKEFD
jgi:hypothetical protein